MSIIPDNINDWIIKDNGSNLSLGQKHGCLF